MSSVIVDDARRVKRTTNWPGKLPERADFFMRMKALAWPNVQAFFADPLCVGFSAKHAATTLDELSAAGIATHIHMPKTGSTLVLNPGDTVEDFCVQVNALANAAHQRALRKRRS